jgi:hypothetical protein
MPGIVVVALLSYTTPRDTIRAINGDGLSHVFIPVASR